MDGGGQCGSTGGGADTSTSSVRDLPAVVMTNSGSSGRCRGVGTWLGIVFAAVLKLALAFAMLGIFVFAWWW